jgi:hypothetical protein
MKAIPRAEWGNQAQWAVTAPLLAAHLAGVRGALLAVLVLCAITIAYYTLRLGGLRPARVQIRLGFFAVVALGALPGIGWWILWLPLCGTTAQVLFGYCPMARMLQLMPWNRTSRPGWRDVLEVALRPPGDEGLLSFGRAHSVKACVPAPAPSVTTA